MPAYSILLSSFTAGEVDPRLRDRVDTDLYRRGLDRGLNITVIVQGGLSSRPGSAILQDVAPVSGRPDWSPENV